MSAAPAPQKDSRPADGYLLAACVQDNFDPDSLRPLEHSGISRGNLDALLAASLVTQTGASAFEWRLPDEARKQWIDLLARRGLLEAAIRLNSAEGDRSVYQEVFEAYVQGTMPALDQQSLEQLQATLQAIHLLGSAVPGLPDEGVVTAMVQRQTFAQQFRLLADQRFFGREEELIELARYVDVLPTSSLRTVGRALRGAVSAIGFESAVRELPLLLSAPGGSGKSALLAKFILQHLDGTVSRRLAFAYIDFDRAAIWPDEPLTLLADMATQLAVQLPEQARRFQSLAYDISAEISEGRGYQAEFDSDESFIGGDSLSTSRQRRYMHEFLQTFDYAFRQGRQMPFLLVLDTFEQVAQRADSYLRVLWQFIESLRELFPRLRVVLSGRISSLPNYAAHELIELAPLDQKSVLELLHSYGATNSRTNDAIWNRVGGHPLSLRLTAQLMELVAQRDKVSIDSLTWGRLFANDWQKHLAQGLIFRRIVDHIENSEVRKVANPGFVLREVSPEILFRVLNSPCELALKSPWEAQELFDLLAQYSSLASMRGAGVLTHRFELRQLVLSHMIATDRRRCREIWTSAVRYYQAQDSPSSRAEEMYCRLMLDQEPEVLASRWRGGIESSLLTSRDEMPSRAKAFLDYRVMLADGDGSIDSDRAPLGSGSDVKLLHAAEELKHLLSRGLAGEAVALIDRHHLGATLSPRDPLYVLVARTMAQAGRVEDALTITRAGLDELSQLLRTSSPGYLDLLLLACQISAIAVRRPRAGRKIWSRAVETPHLPTPELWRRFREVHRVSVYHYACFRVATLMLELIESSDDSQFETEDLVIADMPVVAGNRLRSCISKTLKSMEKIDFSEGDSVDGMLVLRAFAWLGSHVQDERVISLLRAPSAQRVYTQELRPYLEEKLRERVQTQQILERLVGAPSNAAPLEMLAQGSAAFEISDLALSMKHAIQARDLRISIEYK